MHSLRLRILGTFEVEGVEPRNLGSRKARLLLKALAAAEGRPVSVDELIEILWANGLPARPSDQLAVLVSRLRSVLGTERIIRSDAGYAVRADWIDASAFREIASEAERRGSVGGHRAARAAADAALELARGPLVADEFDAGWLAAQRAEIERTVARVRAVGARASLVLGDQAAAVELATRALDDDPYDEAALRLLMEAHAAAGRPAAALAAYQTFRDRLVDELGADPARDTQALHEAILRGQPSPVADDRSDGAAAVHSSPDRPDLPGRQRELRWLDDAFARSMGGRTEIALVTGEAGIGKTRLLEHWSAGLGRVATVLFGRCHELGRGLPLAPVFDALAAHLRGRPDDDVAAILGPQGSVLEPLLGPTAGSARYEPGTTAALGDAQTGRALLFSTLLAVIERMAEERPVVLVCDDAHLAGRSTAEWFHFVSRRRSASSAPILVAAAARAEEPVPLEADDTLVLGPLDVDAAEALVGRRDARRLHERSGGNPLFLVELAAADDDDLPSSITTAVDARCARAGEAAATLRTAAVIGPEVDLDLLAAVLPLPTVTLLEHLEEGVRRSFLDERGPRFVFRHELLREALASGSGPSRRAFIHREVATALSGRPRWDPLRVAHHARLGGNDVLASDALLQAARMAGERYDFEEAERLLGESLQLHDRSQARLQRARVRIAMGRYGDAAEDARVAIGQGSGGPALEVAGWIAYYERDWAAAAKLVTDGARTADDPSIKGSCLAVGGRIHHMEGRLAEAEHDLEEAVELCGPSGASVPRVWLAALRVHQGRADEALQHLPTVLPDGSLQPFAALHLVMNRAYALGHLGRPAEALYFLAELDELVRRMNVERFAGRADNFRGWVLRNVGAGAEADESNIRGLEAAQDRDLVEATAHALIDLADGRLREGDPDAARSYLNRAQPLQDIPHALSWRHTLRARLLAARAALIEGVADDAHAAASRIAEEADALGLLRYSAAARALRVRTAVAVGDGVDLTETAQLLEGLRVVAGLEAWWLSAEIAAATRVDDFWRVAERYAESLAARSGDRRHEFLHNVDRHFDGLRSTVGRGAP